MAADGLLLPIFRQLPTGGVRRKHVVLLYVPETRGTFTRKLKHIDTNNKHFSTTFIPVSYGLVIQERQEHSNQKPAFNCPKKTR
jgi:hypothetical protein